MAGKSKGSNRQKNIHITNRITTFLVLNFYKYCRYEITTRYKQCSRQTKRSKGVLTENGGGGGTIKYAKLLLIKTDFLKLQFCIRLQKKRHKSPKRNQGFAKGEEA